MMHINRIHGVSACMMVETLAGKLSGPESMSWCSCTGFILGRLLLLCDQTSPDGAGEWAAFLLPTDGPTAEELTTDGARHKLSLVQIESITFSWIEAAAEAREVLLRLLRNEEPSNYGTHVARLEGRGHECVHCR